MNGNDTRRTRHAFRPGVDSLEERLVLSPGGAMRAAQVEQLRENRNLLREQRIEHRQQHQLARHRRFAAATPAIPAVTNSLGTTAQSTQQDSRDVALQASLQSTSWMQSVAAAGRNPNQVPLAQIGSPPSGRTRQALGLVSGVSNNQTPRTVSTGGSTPNSTAGTLLSSQFVPDTLAQLGATQNGTAPANPTPLTNATSGARNLFNNISTAPGTISNIAGTVFNNSPISPGTGSISGLIANGTGTLLGTNTNGTIAQGTPLVNTGASAANPFGTTNFSTGTTGNTTTNPAVVNTTPGTTTTSPQIVLAGGTPSPRM